MPYNHSAPEKEQFKEKQKIIMTFMAMMSVFKPVIRTCIRPSSSLPFTLVGAIQTKWTYYYSSSLKLKIFPV